MNQVTITKLTSRDNVGSSVDIDLFDSIFKARKRFYCRGFKNFCVAKNFLGNKKLTKLLENY